MYIFGNTYVFVIFMTTVLNASFLLYVLCRQELF
jgi:hypothetical protein